MKNEKTLKIVETGLLLALILTFQIITKQLGQIVTGSLVNLCLGIAALFCGPLYSAILALLSPIFASLFGIGPKYVILIVGIMAGNLVYVLVMSLVLKKFKEKKWIIGGVIFASVCKFLAIFILNVKVFLPTLTDLKVAARQKLALSFGIPQLITALIGGMLAFLIVNILKKNKKDKGVVHEE